MALSALRSGCRASADALRLAPGRRGTASYRELSRTEGIAGFPHVNARFKQDPPRTFQAPTEDNACGTPSKRHFDGSTWSETEVRKAAVDHCMLTWSGAAPLESIPIIEKAEGVYLYDTTGKKYLDWTSEAVCVNLGHTVPEGVKKAMVDQLDTMPFVYGGIGFAPIRAKLASLLAELAPGDLNGFLFPSSGGEANDCAIRLARLYTGKTKIFNQYRSYHGGTVGPLSATGDFRRKFGGEHATGFVKMFNPEPHFFRWGNTDERACSQALACLEEQIVAEGPSTIAAIMLESVPGSAGVLIPAVGYMEGVRALCNKYDILMIADEVMTGFGRCGELFAFQHFDGVIPDIFTSAKGLTGSWQPLSMVGMRQPIKDFFWNNPTGWGSTFQAHPVALACGYACLKHFVETDILGHINKSIQPVMISELNRLVEKYDCVRQARALGAFGCLDLQDPKTGERPMQVGEAMPPPIANFKKAFNEEGLIGFVRPPQLHCAPPLVITEAELRDGFARLDRALAVLEAELK
jgi:adenosylmethionine-8-amino-7-oxononanoate aminotransferase